MESRPLGTTGEDVTETALGAWEMGGDWSDVDEAQARTAIRTPLVATEAGRRLGLPHRGE